MIKAWVGTAAASAPGKAADASKPKPNILFILTEDQGAHLGFLGTPGLQTPHMDSLARSGVLFRNAFVAYPVCSPSKACIYTGAAQPRQRHPQQHRRTITNRPTNSPRRRRTTRSIAATGFATDIPTLVERLKARAIIRASRTSCTSRRWRNFRTTNSSPTDGEAVAGFIAARREDRQAVASVLQHQRFAPAVSEQRQGQDSREARRGEAAGVSARHAGRAEGLGRIPGRHRGGGSPGRAKDWRPCARRDRSDNTIIVFLGGDHGPAFPAWQDDALRSRLARAR